MLITREDAAKLGIWVGIDGVKEIEKRAVRAKHHARMLDLMSDEVSPLSEAKLRSGGETLHAFRLSPPNEVRARLAIFHGYGEHGARYVPFMSWMRERGIASATFDFRGQGRSTGRRGYAKRWEHFLDDVANFLEWESLAAPAQTPLFVLGHSHGGLVLAAAVIQRRIIAQGFVLSSPFLRPNFSIPISKRLLGSSAGVILPWLRVRTGLRESWLSSDAQMLEETRNDPLMNRIATPRWFTTMLKAQKEVMGRAAEFDRPLFCMTGSADGVADPSAAVEFVNRATSGDKLLRVYDGFRHELLREKERNRVYSDVLEWIVRRI